jgi:hypothetical protein
VGRNCARLIGEFAGTPADPIARVAALVVANGLRGLITGPGGTGKTRWIEQIIGLGRERYPHLEFKTCASLTAAAMLLPGGRTLSHLVQKNMYNKVSDTRVHHRRGAGGVHAPLGAPGALGA